MSVSVLLCCWFISMVIVLCACALDAIDRRKKRIHEKREKNEP